jgi:hypothetical protein
MNCNPFSPYVLQLYDGYSRQFLHHLESSSPAENLEKIALKHSGMHSFRIGSAKHPRRTYFNPRITILEVELVTSNKYGKTTRSYEVDPEENTWKKLRRLLQGVLHAAEHLHILRRNLRERLYNLWDIGPGMGHGLEPVFDKLVNLKIVSEGMISVHVINNKKLRWCEIQHRSSMWCSSGGCIPF